MNDVNWDTLLQDKDSQQSWDVFQGVLDRAIKDHVPLRTIRSQGKPPWLNKNVMRTIRKKRKLWNAYKNTKNYEDYLAYKNIENLVKKSVRKPQKKLESRLAKDIKKNPKAFYKYINSKSGNRETVGPLKVDDVLIENDKVIAEKLNVFFASVFTSDDINCDINMDKLKENATELNSIDITSAKVKDKLDKLKPFSAPGPDGLSPFILKELSTEIFFPLSVSFQRSLNEGLVPSDWKLANVTPIFKKGSKFEPGNYRPVSLTSILCKVMESILRDAMIEHLKDNKLIFSSQHGFVNRRSCLTNLLEYFEKVSELIDQGNSVDILYLDFAK